MDRSDSVSVRFLYDRRFPVDKILYSFCFLQLVRIRIKSVVESRVLLYLRNIKLRFLFCACRFLFLFDHWDNSCIWGCRFLYSEENHITIYLNWSGAQIYGQYGERFKYRQRRERQASEYRNENFRLIVVFHFRSISGFAKGPKPKVKYPESPVKWKSISLRVLFVSRSMQNCSL